MIVNVAGLDDMNDLGSIFSSMSSHQPQQVRRHHHHILVNGVLSDVNIKAS